LKWAALLWWLTLLVPAWAQAADSPPAACTAQILSVQSVQGDADGNRPDAAANWQPVTLPDNWKARWPDYSGTAWYRIDWQHQCSPAAELDLALLIELVNMAGEVYINDSLIWRDAQLTEPLTRSWNMPRYWRLSDALLKEGSNTLWVRVVGVAGQSPGIGKVHLGEAQALQQLYDKLWQHNRTLIMVNIVITAVMGGLFFCIWLSNRKQTAYGWYAMMALFWVLFIYNVVATDPWPFPNSAIAAKANAMALVMYVACFCMFTWRFGEQSMPRVEKTLWFVSAALLLMLVCMPTSALEEALALGLLLPAAFFFINCLQFPFHAWRTKQREHQILAVGLLIFFVVAAYDLLLMMKVISGSQTFTPFLTSLSAMLCMSAVLGIRHANNMRRIERFNQELEKGIDHARTELGATLEREHKLVLTNTRLQERLEIAHDLHDGLGGSLVRMMAMVEQADKPLQNQQFLSMLKLIRDDLRQTIDSGSSSGVKVPTTPGEWIAPLRHRFMQLFDELDIEATWQVPEAWHTPPNALQCLALTRLVEEALINIVKHSRAGRVQLQLQQPEPAVLIVSIEDDGVGFDVAAVRQAGISIGMRSMHARITAVNGTLDVRSVAGHTTLTATLQLAN